MLRTLILLCVIVWLGILCFAKSVQLDLSKPAHLERVNVRLDNELQAVSSRIKAAGSGSDQQALGTLLVKQGELLWALQRFPAALAATERGITIQEKHFGAGSLELTPALLTQAAVLRDSGKFDDALDVYERVQTIDQKNNQPKPILARDYNNQALCMQLAARTSRLQQDKSRFFGDAELLYRKAYDAAGESGAANKNVIAYNLAALLDDMGRPGEARRWREIAVLPKPF